MDKTSENSFTMEHEHENNLPESRLNGQKKLEDGKKIKFFFVQIVKQLIFISHNTILSQTCIFEIVI